MSDAFPDRESGAGQRSETAHSAENAHGETAAHSAEHPHGEVVVKTGVAAVFALVLGLLALVAALTGVLAPVAIVLGVIGLILGIVGIRSARSPRTTGKGVAIGGLVLGIIATLLGIAALIGAATVLSSNPQILDQLQKMIDNARS